MFNAICYRILPQLFAFVCFAFAGSTAVASELGGETNQVQKVNRQLGQQAQQSAQKSLQQSVDRLRETLPSKFHGWWAGDCKVALEASKNDVLEGYKIGANTIDQYEDGCTVKKISRLQPVESRNKLAVDLECEMEGDFYQSTVELELISNSKLSVFYPKVNSPKHIILNRCGN